MKICAHAWHSNNSPSCCMEIVIFFIWLCEVAAVSTMLPMQLILLYARQLALLLHYALFPLISFILLFNLQCVHACMHEFVYRFCDWYSESFFFYCIHSKCIVYSFHLLTCFMFSLRQATQLIITLNDIHFYFVHLLLF